jgi:tRNA pseudouridine55 synthase
MEIALDCMEEVKATDEGAVRLRNGNPGMVIARDVEFGEECWASHDGKPVAVGIYRGGELHPNRVFNL